MGEQDQERPFFILPQDATHPDSIVPLLGLHLNTSSNMSLMASSGNLGTLGRKKVCC